MVNKKVAPKKKIRVNSRLVMEKLKETGNAELIEGNW